MGREIIGAWDHARCIASKLTPRMHGMGVPQIDAGKGGKLKTHAFCYHGSQDKGSYLGKNRGFGAVRTVTNPRFVGGAQR